MLTFFTKTGKTDPSSPTQRKVSGSVNLSRRRKLPLVIVIIGVLISTPLTLKIYNLYRYHVAEQTRFMMDTYVTIYAIGVEKVTSRAITLAFERMHEIELKFDPNNAQNPLYDFNHKGAPVTDPEIIKVVRTALDIARLSDFAFDITVAPLIELWGFNGNSPRLPSPGEIQTVLRRTGSQHLSLKGGRLEKTHPDVRIDLGGIAKGYAVSQAAAVLRKEGVQSALINAGGDIYALGKKRRDLWKVGIRSPRDDELLGYLEVHDLAVMGSGDYERFFFRDGKRYHHIIDPETGYPAEGLRGTTLIHSEPMLADAWNTAIFVLGPEKGLALVEKDPGMEALMVTSSGRILYSSGLKNALRSISARK